MRKIKLVAMTALMALLAMAAVAQEAKPAAAEGGDAAFKTDAEKVGYLIGNEIGRNLGEAGIKNDIDIEKLVAGLRDGVEGKEPKIPEAEAQQIMMAFSMKMQQKMQAKQTEDADKNTAEGEKFLAENKAKEGVKTTASGLQYQILTEGKGDSPKATDEVSVHYRGTLLNGEEFDSSYERGEPTEFPLNRVIPGWTEGLQLMKVGGKAKFWIPGSLAYGMNPPPGNEIGPNQLLVFEVELLNIVKPEAGDMPQFSIEPAQPKQEEQPK